MRLREITRACAFHVNGERCCYDDDDDDGTLLRKMIFQIFKVIFEK